MPSQLLSFVCVSVKWIGLVFSPVGKTVRTTSFAVLVILPGNDCLLEFLLLINCAIQLI